MLINVQYATYISTEMVREIKLTGDDVVVEFNDGEVRHYPVQGDADFDESKFSSLIVPADPSWKVATFFEDGEGGGQVDYQTVIYFSAGYGIKHPCPHTFIDTANAFSALVDPTTGFFQDLLYFELPFKNEAAFVEAMLKKVDAERRKINAKIGAK